MGFGTVTRVSDGTRTLALVERISCPEPKTETLSTLEKSPQLPPRLPDPLLSVHLCILWSRACEVKPVINTERTSQFHLPVRSPDAAKAQAHLPHRPNPGCFISI